jgi:hypothetical protein
MFDADQAAKARSVETIWNTSLHILGSRTSIVLCWPTSTDQFARPMSQISKAIFPRQGPSILRNVNATAALNPARGTGQSAEIQPGAGSWAKAHLASGDLAEQTAKLIAKEASRSSPTAESASRAVPSPGDWSTS